MAGNMPKKRFTFRLLDRLSVCVMFNFIQPRCSEYHRVIEGQEVNLRVDRATLKKERTSTNPR